MAVLYQLSLALLISLGTGQVGVHASSLSFRGRTNMDKDADEGMRLVKNLVGMMETNGELSKDNCNIAFVDAESYYLSYQLTQTRPYQPDVDFRIRSVIDIPDVTKIKSGGKLKTIE